MPAAAKNNIDVVRGAARKGEQETDTLETEKESKMEGKEGEKEGGQKKDCTSGRSGISVDVRK